jgi:hypothetical protein
MSIPVDSETGGTVTSDIDPIPAIHTESRLGRIGAVSHLPMSTVLPLISALTGALYLALRTGYAVFYNSFDVSPEEVGFGESDIFIQSAIVVIAGALLIVSVMLAQWVYYRLVDFVVDRVFRNPRSDARALRQGSLMLYYAAKGTGIVSVRTSISDADLFELAQLSLWFQSRPPILLPILRKVFVVLAWIGIGVSFLARLTTIGWIVSSCMVVILAFAVFIAAAEGTATSIQEGHAGYLSPAGLRLLPWGAQHVTTASVPNSNWKPPNSDCLLYLGQANGTSVVYDLRRKETLRLPSSDVVVSTQLTRRSC